MAAQVAGITMDHKTATTIGTACPAPIYMLHSPDCGCSFVLGVVALIPLSIFPLLTYLRMRRNLSSAGRSRMMWFEESATEYYATMFHFKFQHWQSVLLVERWITGAVQPLQLRAPSHTSPQRCCPICGSSRRPCSCRAAPSSCSP